MHCNALHSPRRLISMVLIGTGSFRKLLDTPSQVFVSFFAGRPQLCSWEFGLKKFCFGVIMASKHVNSGADLCLGTSIGNPRVPPSRLPRMCPSHKMPNATKAQPWQDAKRMSREFWRGLTISKTQRVCGTPKFPTCQVIPEGGFGNAQISARKLGLAILQPSLIGSQ